MTVQVWRSALWPPLALLELAVGLDQVSVRHHGVLRILIFRRGFRLPSPGGGEMREAARLGDEHGVV